MKTDGMYEIRRWIETEDPDGQGHWSLFARRKTKRATVRQIRKLASMGYDREVSIYVERIT